MASLHCCKKWNIKNGCNLIVIWADDIFILRPGRDTSLSRGHNAVQDTSAKDRPSIVGAAASAAAGPYPAGLFPAQMASSLERDPPLAVILPFAVLPLLAPPADMNGRCFPGISDICADLDLKKIIPL